VWTIVHLHFSRTREFWNLLVITRIGGEVTLTLKPVESREAESIKSAVSSWETDPSEPQFVSRCVAMPSRVVR
jgi:hypothetical protein